MAKKAAKGVRKALAAAAAASGGTHETGEPWVGLELPGGVKASPVSVGGGEAINELPSWVIEVRLRSGADANRAAGRLLGKAMRFGVGTGASPIRWRRGVVEEVTAPEGPAAEAATGPVLQLRVVSALSLLGYTRNYRTFVGKSAADLTAAVLSEHRAPTVAVRTGPDAAKAPSLPHRVQVGETDLNFLLRTWEDAGLNFLIPADGADQVTLFDAAVQLPGRRHKAEWTSPGGMGLWPGVEAVSTIHRLTAAATRAGDFDWSRPAIAIDATAPANTHRAIGRQWYFGCPARNRNEATSCARRAQEALEAERRVVTGTGRLPLAAAGDRLALDATEGTDGGQNMMLITRFRLDVTLEPEPRARAWFEAVPEDAPLAPLRRADRPVLAGLYPATVIEGDDPDKLGRVRVRFPWDPPGCPGVWCPVQHGNDQVFRPRASQVVHAQFQFGDPDRPWVVDAVYHPGDFPTDPSTEAGYAGVRTPRHETLYVDGGDFPRVHRHVGGDDVAFVSGDRHDNVEGDVIVEVGGQRHVTVAGNAAMSAGKTIILSAERIVLRAGSAFLVLDDSGVTMNGKIVHLNKPGATAPPSPGRPKPAPKPSNGRTRRKPK